MVVGDGLGRGLTPRQQEGGEGLGSLDDESGKVFSGIVLCWIMLCEEVSVKKKIMNK